MNCVIAKIKTRNKEKLFKLISDTQLFNDQAINIQECIEYNPDHNLDEDSWFKVESFSRKDFFLNFLGTPFDSMQYNELLKRNFSDIAYVCSVQGNNYYFQKVTSSAFINKKMIAFGEVAQVQSSDSRIVIKDIPDAIYYRDQDVLVFKNLATISSIFRNIDMLYKEATAEEVSDFLGKPFLSTSPEFTVHSVSKPNRKRISLAMNTLETMNEDSRNQIVQYIRDYCEGMLNLDEDGKFCVSSDEELKYLLYGIEQRFYTTIVGQERRLANSVQSI